MAANQTATSSVPPKKGGIGRIIRNVLLGLVVVAVIGGIVLWQIQRATKARNLEESVLQELKQPEKIAFDALAAHDAVKTALGDNVKDAGGLSRDGSGLLDPTSTVIHFDVAGSKATAKVTAHCAKQQGAWQITEPIQVQPAGGKAIEVPKPGEKPPDVNLEF